MALIMPARVYCGISLLDARKESIIIDYAYSDNEFGDGVTGYLKLDDLAGRNGLKIRDEIRMIRPGLYLGRAYLGNVFGLNFVLDQTENLQPVLENSECFDTTVKKVAAAK